MQVKQDGLLMVTLGLILVGGEGLFYFGKNGQRIRFANFDDYRVPSRAEREQMFLERFVNRWVPMSDDAIMYMDKRKVKMEGRWLPTAWEYIFRQQYLLDAHRFKMWWNGRGRVKGPEHPPGPDIKPEYREVYQKWKGEIRRYEYMLKQYRFMSWRQKAKITGKMLAHSLKGPEDPGGGVGGGRPPKENKPTIPEGDGTPPKVSMKPGIVTGKLEDIAYTPKHPSDVVRHTWTSKYVHRHHGKDGSVNSHIKVPYDFKTRRKDQDGEFVHEKRYRHYWFRLTPSGPRPEKARVYKIQRDEVVDHKTVTDKDGKEKVKYQRADKPAVVKYAYKDFRAEIIEGKKQSKEKIIFDHALTEFAWDIVDNGKVKYVQVKDDIEDPMFGGIRLVAKDTGEYLKAHIPPPTAFDAENVEIACHWELKGITKKKLILVVDDDLFSDKPVRTYYEFVDRIGKDGEVVKDETGEPVRDRVEKEELHTWVGPFEFDPSVTWDGSAIEVAGDGNMLANIKTMYNEWFDPSYPADASWIEDWNSTDWSATPGTAAEQVGAEFIQVSTDQAYRGTRSLEVYRDGANNCLADMDNGPLLYDYARIEYYVRVAQVNARFRFLMESQVPQDITEIRFENDGNVYIYYGNGAGANNVVNAGAYAANTWYQIRIDLDVTSDVQRTWWGLPGKMTLWQGPNADASGWDNFYSDRVATNAQIFRIFTDNGTGRCYVDDLHLMLGDEIYNYGLDPIDGDYITEAVSPSGGHAIIADWDGDWDVAHGTGANPVVDNTDFILGTQSVTTDAEINDNAGGFLSMRYSLDTAIDASNYEGIEGYLRYHSSTGGLPTASLRIIVWTDGANYYWYDVVPTMTEDRWLHYKIPWADFTVVLAPDQTSIAGITIIGDYAVAGETGQFWNDGLRFYGARNGRGMAWCSQDLQTETQTSTFLNRSVPWPHQHSPQAESDSSLVSSYILNADGDDVSGHGYDLTPINAPTYVDNNLFGGDWDCVNYDGVNQYHRRVGQTELESLTNMTIEGRFKTDTIAAGTDFVWYVWGTDLDRFYLRRATDKLHLSDDINNAGVNYYLADIVTDRWYSYQFVINAATNRWRFYLDGVKVLDVANAKDIASDMTNADLYVGAGWFGAAAINHWNGQQSDINIYNVAKDQDFSQLRAGAGKDLYIDDSKGITINESGIDEQLGGRFPQEPNDLCEATTDWAGTWGSTISSLSDAVYGSNSVRATQTNATQSGFSFHGPYDWGIDLQRIAGAKETIARYGKMIFRMKTSNASCYISDMAIYTGAADRLLDATDITLTTYWRKYEIELSAFTGALGTLDWADINRLWISTLGGVPGDTVDICDVHFEERCVTDRSTTTGAVEYDTIGSGIIDWRYSELQHCDQLNCGGDVAIKHSTIENATDALYIPNNPPSFIIIEDCKFQAGSWAFTTINVTAAFFDISLLELDGGTYDLYVFGTSELILSNTILVNDGWFANATGNTIIYNNNNVNGEHEAWGTVPFDAASYSDFPRSRTRLTNSDMGWATQAGMGEAVSTQDGAVFMTNSEGANVSIWLGQDLCNPIDLGPQGDQDYPNNTMVDIKTDGGDAAWELLIYFSTAGRLTDYIRYDTNQANDIDAVVNIDCSGAPSAVLGNTDRANINYIYIRLNDIATGGIVVRAWLRRLFIETDAGKVMFEGDCTLEQDDFTLAANTKMTYCGRRWWVRDRVGWGDDHGVVGAAIATSVVRVSNLAAHLYGDPFIEHLYFETLSVEGYVRSDWFTIFDCNMADAQVHKGIRAGPTQHPSLKVS